MIGHIFQRDWCNTRDPRRPFVDEEDIDNSVIERILRNKFWDPLISSDEEESVGPIDWSTVFRKRKTQEFHFNNYVPGCRKPPPHPKLSALTKTEHYQMIKVLTSSKDVLPKLFIGKVTKTDMCLFEEKNPIYTKEQQEYTEWARDLWVTTNFIRALRPKPPIERVYEAELKMNMHMLQCLPKNYILAAQIPLQSEKHKCEILLPKNDLIEVNISDLPEVLYPPITQRRCNIMTDIPVPEPCTQHPCKFKLPNESTESLLPLTEIQQELAQFALDNGAQYVCSERGLACLLELDRSWAVPVSVRRAMDPDGERSNIVVMGSEFPLLRDFARMRTFKAIKHMLYKAFTARPSRQWRFSDSSQDSARGMSLRPKRPGKEAPSPGEPPTRSGGKNPNTRKVVDRAEDSDSDDDRLLIDFAGVSKEGSPQETAAGGCPDRDVEEARRGAELGASPPRKVRRVPDPPDIHMELDDCVCKDTEFESPKPRSYKNVQIKNTTTKDQINVIVHCSHKLRSSETREVVLEPIVEYQLDVGGSLQSPRRLRALALALALRPHADLVNVRVDASGGEVVTIDTLSSKELSLVLGDWRPEVANSIYTALNQLAGLLPGHYLLVHEPEHGCNAILYSSAASAAGAASRESVSMEFGAQPAGAEARQVQAPPALAPVLLPHHKYRRTLPLAFTYDPRFVAKTTKPATRAKPPPPAMLWPNKGKKKGRKKKKKNDNN